MSEYEKKVKHRLIDLEMPEHVLIARVAEKTGMYFDRSYLSKIFRGKCHSAKLISAINEIVGIDGGAE